MGDRGVAFPVRREGVSMNLRIANRFRHDRASALAAGARSAAAWLALAAATLLASPGEGTAQGEESPLRWTAGPQTAPIGEIAEIDLPAEYVYLDAEGTRKLLQLTENIPSGDELATIAPVNEEQWFVIFEFEDSGYVPDDEKDELDAEAMIDSIRAGTEAANEERRKRGWQTMTIVGWREAPHYDETTNNLSWAIDGETAGVPNVNRMVKLLGRRGVMSATLVGSPDEMGSAIPQVNALLEGYRFTPGHTYAEYVPGTDKLAEYGLTALVVGGGAAALAKSGLLARLWKPIALGLVALGAGVKRFFFGGRSAAHDPEKPIA
jgi:uncharacterized membrane-anchored protein